MPAPVTKSEYVENELKSMIITGKLAPGSQLDLDALAESLGVSKMPIRQALTQLQARGLVEISPQRWTQVTAISVEEIDDIYHARRALAEMLAAQALPRLQPDDLTKMQDEIDKQKRHIANREFGAFVASDREFHLALYGRANFPRSLAVVTELRDVADRYIHAFIEEGSHGLESIREHQVIVDRCAAGDVDGLRAIVGEHIERGRQDLRARFSAKELRAPIESGPDEAGAGRPQGRPGKTIDPIRGEST